MHSSGLGTCAGLRNCALTIAMIFFRNIGGHSNGDRNVACVRLTGPDVTDVTQNIEHCDVAHKFGHLAVQKLFMKWKKRDFDNVLVSKDTIKPNISLSH